MRGVSFLFIALPDFYRIYQFACTVYIIPVSLFRLTSFVHVPSFTLFPPIALNIVSSSTVTRYINLSSSRDRRSRFSFLVALSNDVQSYVYLVAQRLFLSSLRTYTHKKNTHRHTHTDTERTSMKSSDDILKIWVGKKKKGNVHNTRHAHEHVHAQRKTPDSMENGRTFFYVAMLRGCVRAPCYTRC